MTASAAWSNGPQAAAAMDRPELLDNSIRPALIREGGQPSTLPLGWQLASMLASWAGPLALTDDGALVGREHGQPIRITPSVLRDMFARRNLAPQMGVTPTAADAEEAVRIAAGRARVEHERQTVAAEAMTEQQHLALEEEVRRARERARLLSALEQLDSRPTLVPADPPPRWSNVRRRYR